MKTRGLAALALVVLLAGCGGPASDDDAPEERPRPEPVQEERLKTEPADDPAAEDPAAEDPAADPAADAASSAALDLYVAGERAAMENMPGLEMYGSVEVEAVYPSTARFVYVYAEPIDDATASTYFDTMASTFEDLCNSVIFPAMEQLGVVDPVIVYTYYNPDGALIWEQTFTKG